jgi:hypothetical protein
MSGPWIVADLSPSGSVTINCSTCPVRGVEACSGCVVAALIGPPPGIAARSLVATGAR